MVVRLPGFFEASEMPDANWWEALWPNPARVLAAVGLLPGLEAIDLCSGDGWFTLHIAKVARHVIAIDIDCDLLELARQRLKSSGLANCDFIAANAYEIGNLGLRPAHFVFLANTFHGVPDPTRLARAVYDAVKPLGRFVIVNWRPLPREETIVLGKARGPRTELRMSPDQTIAVVEPAGLRLRHIVELAPYHYGAVFERPAAKI